MPNQQNTQHVAQQIEALLFVDAGEIKIDSLAHILSVGHEEIERGLSLLDERYKSQTGGLVLVRAGSTVALATSPEASDMVQEIAKKALDRDVGPAGLEVLAILLYKGAATRAGIDYIRGVNSASTLRNLFMRELIERVKNPKDAREFLYKPTTTLLAHLGVSRTEDLPEYEARHKALLEFEQQAEKSINNTPDE